MALSQLFLYPKVAEFLGALRTLRLTLALYAFFAICFPVLVYLPNANDGTVIRVYVTILTSVMGIVGMWMFTTVIALINNSACASDLATVNAIGQVCPLDKSDLSSRAYSTLRLDICFSWTLYWTGNWCIYFRVERAEWIGLAA